MKTILFFELLLITLLIGCNNLSGKESVTTSFPAEKVTVINLNTLEKGALIPFDSLFTGYEYIQNKSGNRFTVTKWERLRFDGDQHFIGINIPYSYINLYNAEGNFIRRLGQQGTQLSQGEFEDIFNFCIDPTAQKVYALANNQGKVIRMLLPFFRPVVLRLLLNG